MKMKQRATSNEHGAHQRVLLVRSRRGFSLAEVLLAITITSFALLALIGVLPEGLRSLQNAQRQEAEARIVQHLAAKYQAKAWEDLSRDSGRQDFTDFDANGAFVEPNSKEIIYRARTEVMNGLPLPNESAASAYLKRVRVRITNQINSSAAFETAGRYRERYVTLVNGDKTPDADNTAHTGTSTSSDSGSGGSPTNP